MKHYKHIITKILFVISTSYVFLYAYCELSRLWSLVGGTSSKLVYFEYPIIILLYIIFYFPISTKKERLLIFIHLSPLL